MSFLIVISVAVLVSYVTGWPRPLDGTSAAMLAVVALVLSLVHLREDRIESDESGGTIRVKRIGPAWIIPTYEQDSAGPYVVHFDPLPVAGEARPCPSCGLTSGHGMGCLVYMTDDWTDPDALPATTQTDDPRSP